MAQQQTTHTPWYATAPREGFSAVCWDKWEKELRFSRGARMIASGFINTVLDHDSKRSTLGKGARARLGVVR